MNKDGRCHLFRDTMATLMLENGADIRFIQQMLGYAQRSTTEIYTHVAIHKLKSIHAATHPARLPDGVAERLRGSDPTDPEPTADDVLEALELEDEDDGEAEFNETYGCQSQRCTAHPGRSTPRGSDMEGRGL